MGGVVILMITLYLQLVWGIRRRFKCLCLKVYTLLLRCSFFFFPYSFSWEFVCIDIGGGEGRGRIQSFLVESCVAVCALVPVLLAVVNGWLLVVGPSINWSGDFHGMDLLMPCLLVQGK